MKATMLFALAAPFVWAQNAQITGRITDSTQAAVPNVEVTATHADTRIARRARSNDQGFFAINIINMTSANSIYHSLQVKVERRFSKGVSVLMSYTAGKVITDSASQVSPIGPTSVAAAQNWYDLRSERAINGVSSYRGGVPLSLSAPIPGGGNRPNSTGKSAEIDGSRSRGQQIAQWFDTSQFSLPASFTLGNVSRTLPNSAFGSGQFGRVTGTIGLPRVGQLALKLNF